MRKFYLLILFWIFIQGQSFASDTLKQYNPSVTLVSLPTNYKEVVARVDLPCPGTLEKLVIRLDGPSNSGSVMLKVYGHEGGTSFPQLEQSLIEPLKIEKTKEGRQDILVKLKSPLSFRNNQLFLVLYDWTKDVQIMAESSPPLASCKSSSGGDYYRLFAKNSSGSWVLVNRRALAADLIYSPEKLPATPYFRDMTLGSGIPEGLSNKSISVGDLNGDDFLDIVIRGRVFFNKQNFQFEDKTLDLSITTAGIVASPIIDINNDGKSDILLLYNDSASHQVLINQGGGQFNALSLSAQIPVRGISSFSIADINEDGFPDIFIGRLWTAYPADGPDITPNYLYLNTGKNDFNDSSSMIYPNNWVHRRSRGSSWCDFDNDGDLDLFVANYYLEPDELWKNDGNGNFVDIAQYSGIDKNKFGASSHGTGCDFGDFNNDGNMDLLLPNLAHPAFKTQYDHLPTTLYKNNGAPSFLFSNVTDNSGIEYEETHAGGAWADIDNDGRLDFIITTFYGCRYIDLYKQNDSGAFEIVTAEYGLEGIVSGEDACWADFDNDGKIDLCLGIEGKFRIYKNEVPSWHHNQTQIELRATSGNKLAIGSRVKVYAGGNMYTQEVTAGRGVRMQKPARLTFGLAEATQVDSVEVYWIGSKQKSVFKNVQINTLNYLMEDGSVKLNIEEFPKTDLFHVYPNPSAGDFNITAADDLSLNVYSVQGKLIQGNLEVHRAETIKLKLQPGVYIIQASDKNLQLFTKRIIIE